MSRIAAIGLGQVDGHAQAVTRARIPGRAGIPQEDLAAPPVRAAPEALDVHPPQVSTRHLVFARAGEGEELARTA